MRTCLYVEAFTGAHPSLPPACFCGPEPEPADGSGGHVNRQNLNKQKSSRNSIPPSLCFHSYVKWRQPASLRVPRARDWDSGSPRSPNILTCSELWERGGRRWRWPSRRLEIKTARDRRGVDVSRDRSGGAVGLGSFFCHFWFGFSWLPVEMIHYKREGKSSTAFGSISMFFPSLLHPSSLLTAYFWLLQPFLRSYISLYYIWFVFIPRLSSSPCFSPVTSVMRMFGILITLIGCW